jgi:hypothetical protein
MILAAIKDGNNVGWQSSTPAGEPSGARAAISLETGLPPSG